MVIATVDIGTGIKFALCPKKGNTGKKDLATPGNLGDLLKLAGFLSFWQAYQGIAMGVPGAVDRNRHRG